MDLLNKAKSSFAMMGKEVTQKASDASGIAKVSLKLKEEEKELQNAIANLGQQYIEQYPDDAMKKFPEISFSINKLRENIEKDKRELAIHKGMRICSNCGAEQDKTAMCCTVCGINMDEADRLVAPEPKSAGFCGNCGQPLAANSKFCMNCGAPCEK